MKYRILLLASIAVACQSGSDKTDAASGATQIDTIHYEAEKHLANITQLTWGGDNAEAYFSFDGSMLTFQSNNPAWGLECDQIYAFNWSDDSASLAKPTEISNGLGRTTCAYFMPGDSTILYASTFAGNNQCPPAPEHTSDAYVWPIYEDFDIYVSNLKGEIVDTLVSGPGYDAEATLSPNGDLVVFTSIRTGDLELFTCDINGENVHQVTNGLGYDGGAFFSPDGTKLIFRSSRPQTEEEIAKYTGLLEKGLVEPTEMELYICNVDGSELTKITDLGNANWAPYFHPSGEKVLFSTNHHSEKGYPFNIFMLDLNTQELEQITFDNVFDSFPMFSPDGKKLVFASNRNNGGTRNTNLFIADWVE